MNLELIDFALLCKIVNDWIMYFMMTILINWNYIITMVFLITIMMMVLFCFISTIIAFKQTWMRHKTVSNSTSNTGRCAFFRSISFIHLPRVFQIFFVLAIFHKCYLASFCFNTNSSVISIVMCMTQFAHWLITVIAFYCFTKLRNGFNLFAAATSFCYDCFRHIRFLIIRWGLGPGSYLLSVHGLFYYNSYIGYVNA